MALAQLGLTPIPRGDASGHGNPKSLERAAPDLAGDVAVWKLARLSAAETIVLSLTLDGPVTAEVLKSFAGSAVHWQNPGRRAAGRPPVMKYRDLRLPDDGDQVPLTVPRMP
jgi:hypothetical protein